MLCIWLNNVSRLVFWQPPKCWSSAREVAKLFACFNKYNSHFWRYPKMSLGNWQQLWQLWQLLSGRKAEKRLKSMSERDSLLINYIIFILAMLWTVFSFMLTASRKYRCNCCNVTEALKASSAGAWDCQPLGLSTCLSACLSVSQASRPQLGWRCQFWQEIWICLERSRRRRRRRWLLSCFSCSAWSFNGDIASSHPETQVCLLCVHLHLHLHLHLQLQLQLHLKRRCWINIKIVQNRAYEICTWCHVVGVGFGFQFRHRLKRLQSVQFEALAVEKELYGNKGRAEACGNGACN